MQSFKYVNIDDNIGEVITKYPESAEVFLSFGLHCVGCFANSFDTIRAGAEIHGMLDEELKEMLDEVNYVVDQKRSVSSNRKNEK